MVSRMIMFGRVPVGGIVAAADMAAAAADPQMQPLAADFRAFLATERARRDILDSGEVVAVLCHPLSSVLKRRPCSLAEKAVQRRHHLRALADRAADPL